MTPVLTLLLSLPASFLAPSPQAAPAGAVLELPMKMRGVMPAVDVMVNGDGPFLFAIDTCASGKGRVDASLVKRLGLPIVGEASGGDGSGKATTMSVAKVEYLELGEIGFEHLELPSRDYNQGTASRIDGILGFGLFEKGVLTLDFPAKKVRYDPAGALPEPDGREILPLVREPVAAFELQVAGKPITAHLDSGNMIGRFVLPTALATTLTPAGEPRSLGKARTVVGETDIVQLPVRESIAIGRFEFPGESIVYPSVGPQVNVGASLMAEFRVSLDQANGRVRFER